MVPRRQWSGAYASRFPRGLPVRDQIHATVLQADPSPRGHVRGHPHLVVCEADGHAVSTRVQILHSATIFSRRKHPTIKTIRLHLARHAGGQRTLGRAYMPGSTRSPMDDCHMPLDSMRRRYSGEPTITGGFGGRNSGGLTGYGARAKAASTAPCRLELRTSEGASRMTLISAWGAGRV